MQDSVLALHTLSPTLRSNLLESKRNQQKGHHPFQEKKTMLMYSLHPKWKYDKVARKRDQVLWNYTRKCAKCFCHSGPWWHGPAYPFWIDLVKMMMIWILFQIVTPRFASWVGLAKTITSIIIAIIIIHSWNILILVCIIGINEFGTNGRTDWWYDNNTKMHS